MYVCLDVTCLVVMCVHVSDVLATHLCWGLCSGPMPLLGQVGVVEEVQAVNHRTQPFTSCTEQMNIHKCFSTDF